MKEILTNKNILRRFMILSAGGIIFLVCLYLYPSFVYSDTLYIVCVNVAIETIVLVAILSILRKLSMFKSWKIIVFYVVIVLGSISTNFLSPAHGESFLPTELAVLVVLIFFNVALSKVIFDVNFRKACLIGVIMGLINALMVIAATPVCS